MGNQERYQDAVRQLLEYGYEVLPDNQGYIVQHISDNDTSHARHIGDLTDFADLMKWRAEHPRK